MQERLTVSVTSEPVSRSAIADSTRHCILVVDDNHDAAASLALLLEMSGHDVHTAADGKEAVECAQRVQPSIIFMDLGMPRMNGLDAACRIRALPHQGAAIHIIALTGWAQESDHERTRSAGMDFHLVKPVSRETLQNVLDQVNAKVRSADVRQSGRPPQKPLE
jgi:CheY-like chemotaxis protein